MAHPSKLDESSQRRSCEASPFNTHTPIPALISGPSSGGPWLPGDPSPRSVHELYFKQVCSQQRIKQIWTHEVKDKYGIRKEKTAKEVFSIWTRILRDDESPCIEVVSPLLEEDPWGEVFDMWLLSTDRILDFWEEFRDSLVSKLLAPSETVLRALDRNARRLFFADAHSSNATSNTSRTVSPQIDPFRKVLAVHIRRGDYVWHCRHLSGWNYTFYLWNQLPWLPDRFSLPTKEEGEEGTRRFMKRCLPDVDAIVAKIECAREDWERETFGNATNRIPHYLTTLYILTNAKREWLASLSDRLRSLDSWSHVWSSADVEFANARERDVGMVIDMEIARRAAVFVGNGWSSFTSNILHQRLVDKKAAISNRFF
ncbi:hypothetical protein DFP72DRAFT_835359 [Ephemerocybe angulata]|uniref:Uncharacterized protein n=1 Tax=Ephemerocybe angulata TaxID=980116 RepID=A0A8H6H5Y7_9AGAR|nr:hypothetical protein DFP72DRAFT_835359 [Tulosesus angulatus]